MTLTFEDKIEIEQIRALEEGGNSLLARFDGQKCPDFASWLRARTASLKQQEPVRDALRYAPHLYHRLLVGGGLLLAVLGIISTSSLLTQADNTLNIFWLLGALLGFNAVSLLLWLLFAVNAGRSNGGIIAPLLHQVMLWLTPRRATGYRPTASRTWFAAQLNPRFHHWHLSRLTHVAWCCYLVGSILGLLLLFATRQFNFIWESTLLSAEAFIRLSQWLATPLQWLGMPTPSEADIVHSGSSKAAAYSSDLRQQWALFLLGCLGIYGLLPRVVAASACFALEYRGRKRWALDLSLPYYRRLHEQYRPSTSQSIIIDPDSEAAPSQQAAAAIAERPVPSNAYWLGLELHPQLPWPGRDSAAYLGEVTDRQSLQALGAQVGELEVPVAIAVEASKAPDRGLQRNLRELLAHCRQPWLALIDTGEVSESKWQNWLTVARKLGFTDTQITRIKLKS